MRKVSIPRRLETKCHTLVLGNGKRFGVGPTPYSDLSDEPASRLVEADLFLIPLDWSNSEPAKKEKGKISFANKKRRLFVKASR